MPPLHGGKPELDPPESRADVQTKINTQVQTVYFPGPKHSTESPLGEVLSRDLQVHLPLEVRRVDLQVKPTRAGMDV